MCIAACGRDTPRDSRDVFDRSWLYTLVAYFPRPRCSCRSSGWLPATKLVALGRDHHTHGFIKATVISCPTFWLEIYDLLRRLACATASGISNRRRESALHGFPRRSRFTGRG